MATIVSHGMAASPNSSSAAKEYALIANVSMFKGRSTNVAGNSFTISRKISVPAIMIEGFNRGRWSLIKVLAGFSPKVLEE